MEHKHTTCVKRLFTLCNRRNLTHTPHHFDDTSLNETQSLQLPFFSAKLCQMWALKVTKRLLSVVWYTSRHWNQLAFTYVGV